MSTRNPKQDGSNLWDCIPQVGPCPCNCNQCYYNRPGAFYVPIDKPHVPSAEEVGSGVVRMNCGNDSNNERELVLETAEQYEHVFFNTSRPKFAFPGPVVFTANAYEEVPAWPPPTPAPSHLMFVRLRVSGTNLQLIDEAVDMWTAAGVPVVLTFMAYYEHEPAVSESVHEAVAGPCYVWKKRVLNSYWCATPEFMQYVHGRYRGKPVWTCGTLSSSLCKDCGNCERFYWETLRRLEKAMPVPAEVAA